jgi:hypothetical protein
MALMADTRAGATSLRLRRGTGVFNGQAANGGGALAVGRTLIVGMPGNLETVTIAAVNGADVEVRPALAREHQAQEPAVEPGTGLELTAPLKFSHAGNLPFSVRGTGISFTPATAFAHANNEPVQPLGTGITLDRPLARAHAINEAVRSEAATGAGYQGTPNQWFGGPVLSTAAGAMVLRDAGGRVVDSLNYGLLVDPWAAEGYQKVSGTGQGGCRVAVPGAGRGPGRGPAIILHDVSAGRTPDGADTDSNCTDFQLLPATNLAVAAAAGATNIKVAGVADFSAGQTIMLDSGAGRENAVIATVGTAGATTMSAATAAGDTVIPVAGAFGFAVGQSVAIEGGTARETATVAAVGGGPGGARITVTAPLASAHAAGTQVSGTGITLTRPLARAHAAGAQVISDLPTPGAPNRQRARAGR